MFYYLNPGFKHELGHHIPHQSAIWQSCKDDFCVVAHQSLRLRDLPYKTINVFDWDTWEYLEDPRRLDNFRTTLGSLRNHIRHGDTLFMYMSDVLFIPSFIEFIITTGLKVRTILNLFHSGHYFITEDERNQNIVNLLRCSANLRSLCGVHLMVEGVDIQERIYEQAEELHPVIPMLHNTATDALVAQEKRQSQRKIISFVSATIERGFFEFIKLIKYIEYRDPDLLDRHEFRMRVLFDHKVYVDNLYQINPKVRVSHGSFPLTDYDTFLKETDIILLPYLSRHFFGRSSGIFSDAIQYEIPVVATKDTWNGAYTSKYEIGVVYQENNTTDFYDALISVIDNYSNFKSNFSEAKIRWNESNSTTRFHQLASSLPIGSIKGLDNQSSEERERVRKVFDQIIKSSDVSKTNIKFSELELISYYPFAGGPRNTQKTLVDVGAHEGGVTKRFAKANWKVIAFEPEQNNRNIFLSHHASNSNVTCIPKAVTDADGQTIPFYISDKHYGIHSIRPFHNTHHKASYLVETITLKTALEEQGINHVSFLKIDTEGADFLALKGFDWNRIKPEVVMVEFMDDRSERNFNYTHHDVVSFMYERGYTCFVSEWEPIVQYGIKGQTVEPHRWVQCVKYPLDHIPSWGNLIFVPEKDETKFVKTLEKYLRDLSNRERSGSFQHLVLQMKRFVKRTFFN